MTALPQAFVTAASALAATVLNALWEDALLVLCVWLLLRAWPGLNAATRYAVWSATLVAAFALPVGTTLWFFSAPAPKTVSVREHVPARGVTTAAGVSPKAAVRLESKPAVAPPRFPDRPRVTLPGSLVAFVVFAWFLLAGYALARLAVGLARLEQLKRDALPLPVEYRDAMPKWLTASKGSRDVRLCVSDETDVPIAVGLFDAMVLVPRSLLERLSEGEVDQICLHELAHLRRADDWTNGLQRVIAALLGWNPAVQFACRQLDLEREVACDDWVLSFAGTVRTYALCLTKMAETAAWPHDPIPAPGVFSTRKHISLRIERLLGAGRNAGTALAPAPAVVAVAAVLAVGLVVAALAPSVAAPIAVAPVAAVSAVPSVAPATPRPAAAAPRPAAAVRRSSAPLAPVTRTKASLPFVAIAPEATQAAPAFPNPPAMPRRPVRIAANGPSCVGCDYSGVNWAGRDLRGATYVGADFSGANLSGTNFSNASFNGVDFSKAKLNGAAFRGAHLTGCDFSDADLTGTDFRGAWMSGCQFRRARLGSSEFKDVLDGCKGCDFGGADLAGLDLSGIRASGDDFSKADLRNVNLRGAVLVGVDFSDARLDGANLTGATLNGCDLSRVDLSHVDLSKTTLIGTDLTNRRTPP